MTNAPSEAVRAHVPPGGAHLHVVGTGAFRPCGGCYDVRPLRRRPLVALRGDPNGLAARFALRAGSVEITILASDPTCSEDDVAWGMSAARGIAAVDDDPTEFLRMANAHPVLSELVPKFDARIARTPTVFESFARAVIEQLVTVFEAKAATRRLFALAGALIAGTGLLAAPTAVAVLGVPPWKLHAIGIGSRRSRALREGARRGTALERLQQTEPEAATTKLQSLPGVGPWTANLVARNALGWSDAVPVGDCHAHYLVTEALTGKQGDDDAMLEALAPFRPHRARVVHVIMQALIADSLPGFERLRQRLPRIDPHRREPWKF